MSRQTLGICASFLWSFYGLAVFLGSLHGMCCFFHGKPWDFPHNCGNVAVLYGKDWNLWCHQDLWDAAEFLLIPSLWHSLFAIPLEYLDKFSFGGALHPLCLASYSGGTWQKFKITFKMRLDLKASENCDMALAGWGHYSHFYLTWMSGNVDLVFFRAKNSGFCPSLELQAQRFWVYLRFFL